MSIALYDWSKCKVTLVKNTDEEKMYQKMARAAKEHVLGVKPDLI